jgi:nucleoside-diphosphate-sugar epimerase
MARILITGGAGFLGRRLAERIAATEPGGTEFIVWDHVAGQLPPGAGSSSRVIVGDLLDARLRAEAFADGTDVVFHLAAVVSAQAEEDFDLGMRVNLDGTRVLLDACRAMATTPKFIMTSSVAVFGGDLPRRVPDQWPTQPRSSYGAAKAVCELLVGEYSRRGFVDGRVLRLPTVVVRPGRPNRAASSFASSMIREPLAGEAAAVPVMSETPMWLMSPDRAVDALVHALELDADLLGLERVISLPGLSVTVGDMASALARVGGAAAAARLDWKFDPAIAAIVQSWPGDFEATRAKELGFRVDANMDDIIRQHMSETGTGGAQ